MNAYEETSLLCPNKSGALFSALYCIEMSQFILHNINSIGSKVHLKKRSSLIWTICNKNFRSLTRL